VLPPVSRSDVRGAARIEHLPATATATRGAARVRTVAWTSEIAEGTALDEAPVVVCVGHGLGKDGVDLARQLATALGGVVGATRRVCDVGWLPRQLQIGISGRSVAPALYVAVGVRGSFNHMVGMQRATRVVAINRDPQAEVFAGADLGIVGDAPTFVAALLARFGGEPA
jgi:electron transfer flavoprotein alpha subunit